MYFVLFVFVSLLFVISYRLFEKDIMQPAVFLNSFFLMGIIVSFYLYDRWHLYDYSLKTVEIIMLGLFCFMACSYLAKKNTIKYTWGKRKITDGSISASVVIKIQFILIVGTMVLCVVTLALFLSYYHTRITGGDILKTIVAYKTSKFDSEESMPVYINFLLKVLCAFSNIFLWVYINNKIVVKRKSGDGILLVPALTYSVLSLLMANRGNILILLMNSFAAWYIIYHRIRGWKVNLTGKFLGKGIKYATVFLVFFWAFMVVVRNKVVVNVKDSFLTYVCAYFGGPLASLDLYIKQGGKVCEWFGQETFVAFNNNIYGLFGKGHLSARFLEFRSGEGHSVVNIYSSFRRFYHDFGILGVAVLSGIQGYVTSRIYHSIKRKKGKKGIDRLMVVYCFFFYTIPYTLTDELFYSSNVSISGLFKLIILLVSYELIMYRARFIEYSN